jgi:hypothetical protein
MESLPCASTMSTYMLKSTRRRPALANQNHRLKRALRAHARAAGCKAFLSDRACHWERPSPSPMRTTDKAQRRDKDRRAHTARRSSPLLAQSLRSGDFTRMIAKHQKTLAASYRRGSQPITPEPAPSHRLWASAWARPHADQITLTRTSNIHLQRGHSYFAGNGDISILP